HLVDRLSAGYSGFHRYDNGWRIRNFEAVLHPTQSWADARKTLCADDPFRIRGSRRRCTEPQRWTGSTPLRHPRRFADIPSPCPVHVASSIQWIDQGALLPEAGAVPAI